MLLTHDKVARFKLKKPEVDETKLVGVCAFGGGTLSFVQMMMKKYVCLQRVEKRKAEIHAQRETKKQKVRFLWLSILHHLAT